MLTVFRLSRAAKKLNDRGSLEKPYLNTIDLNDSLIRFLCSTERRISSVAFLEADVFLLKASAALKAIDDS